MKRTFDILIALAILIAAVIPAAVIILIVFIITQQYPLIKQSRTITLEKRRIKVYKIRTIRSSDKFRKAEGFSRNIYFKEEYREYIPWFCCMLRKTGLDELPQLINVLKGEMSLVGPRPLLEGDLIVMEKIEPEYYYRRTEINLLPGLTGYWQVYGNRAKGSKNLVELDVFYENEQSFYLDMKIILKSILILITASHSDAIIS